MTRLILHIGPLRTETGEPGLTAFLLVPGSAEHPVTFAADLAGAESELRKMADGDALACEPALEAEGARLGLRSAPLDREARDMLALMALDIADRTALARIERDELIGYFCEAAAAFEQRMKQGWPPGKRYLQVSDAEEARIAVVIDGPGLVILDAQDAWASGARFGHMLDVTDGIGAVFAPSDVAVVDALRRAFGLERLPQPFRLERMEKLPLEDNDLALMVATFFAVAVLDPDRQGVASGHVHLDTLKVEVTVTAA